MAGHIYIKNEDGSIYTNSKETYRGVPGSIYIWHGEWSDPEIIWEGESINANDIENWIWKDYKSWCEAAMIEPTDDGCEEYIKNEGGPDYVKGVMDDILLCRNN